MAVWKVSPERISLFPHPGADRLLVARVGMFPLVVGKDNNYEDGQIVVFAPKRSIMPEWLRPNYCNEETGVSYLKDGSIVKSIKLRGELSEGCTITPKTVEDLLEKNNETKEFPEFVDKTLEDLVGVDISSLIGITEYIPPIPLSMAGEVDRLPVTSFSQHDVEGITIFADELEDGEQVICSEKLHGSQGNYIRDEEMNDFVSSKGLIGRNLVLKKSDTNLYWKAIGDAKLKELVDTAYPGSFVQIMFEVIPCQKGFSYGFDKPSLRIFRLEVDRVRISLPQIATYDSNEMKWVAHNSDLQGIVDLWVPVLFVGEYSRDEITKLAKGRETISGKELHIREGIVVEPIIPRFSKNGSFPLLLKIINPKYKGEDDDDALS